jgi:hypothetical protein
MTTNDQTDYDSYIRTLLHMLEEENDARRAAAMTLGKVGDLRALPALSRELARVENRPIRTELRRAIEEILLAMRSRPPAPDLSDYVQQEISQLQNKTLGGWLLRFCKEELNALPLESNAIYVWSLQPDGTVLCTDYEALRRPTEPERDALHIFAALVSGAQRYPPLAARIPQPPRGTHPCPDCDTRGVHPDDEGNADSCLRCGGLGWVKTL